MTIAHVHNTIQEGLAMASIEQDVVQIIPAATAHVV